MSFLQCIDTVDEREKGHPSCKIYSEYSTVSGDPEQPGVTPEKRPFK